MRVRRCKYRGVLGIDNRVIVLVIFSVRKVKGLFIIIIISRRVIVGFHR